MNKLIFDAPLNSLSLGNVSYNFLRELWRKDVSLAAFPVGQQINLEAYDKINPIFKNWLFQSVNYRHTSFSKDVPSLKIWHINGAEYSISKDQYLYTFYEVDSPTPQEINIVKNQKHVFFSSSEAANIFKNHGCENVSFLPLGFDEDFCETSKEYLGKDVVHFGLIGKFERRKNTQGLIQLWLQKYGDNPKYQLTCLIHNPFFPQQDFQNILAQTFGGKRWSNVNILPYLKTNSEVNDVINSIDIDLSGMSNGEGWNLPSFNATALGKWSVVSNCSSHKDWATKENCVLVEPAGKQPCYDNFFFKQGAQFNQGQYYILSQESIVDGFERAEKLAKTKNENGEKLKELFTYSNTVDKILQKIL
jgi:hypothetical protein